jgi:hypothetical protein
MYGGIIYGNVSPTKVIYRGLASAKWIDLARTFIVMAMSHFIFCDYILILKPL